MKMSSTCRLIRTRLNVFFATCYVVGCLPEKGFTKQGGGDNGHPRTPLATLDLYLKGFAGGLVLKQRLMANSEMAS